jgi:hypothetical protein
MKWKVRRFYPIPSQGLCPTDLSSPVHCGLWDTDHGRGKSNEEVIVEAEQEIKRVVEVQQSNVFILNQLKKIISISVSYRDDFIAN